MFLRLQSLLEVLAEIEDKEHHLIFNLDGTWVIMAGDEESIHKGNDPSDLEYLIEYLV